MDDLGMPACRRKRAVRGAVRSYLAACGECPQCVTFASDERVVGGMTAIQRAVVYALDALGGEADMAALERRCPDYLDRAACRGGWHDSLNRVPWRLAELGLARRRRVGRAVRWRLTAAGDEALRADGHEPRPRAEPEASLFG
jgi:hypothetical protein